MQQNTS